MTPSRSVVADLELIEVLEHDFRAMGTAVHLVIGAAPAPHAIGAEDDIRSAEAHLSRFLEGSDVQRLRVADGRPIEVADVTRAVLRRALEASALTGGCFDATMGATLHAAGYDRTFDRIDQASAGTHRRVHDPGAAAGIVIDDLAHTVAVPAGMMLDFGGIAKGFIADHVVASLLAQGVLGACVNIGGDLRVAGPGPDLGPWVVAVDHHLGDEFLVTIDNTGLATSTVARRTWTGPDGRTRNHLLDPATSESVGGELHSVTVIAPDASTAEVLTKVAFLQPHQLAELLDRSAAEAIMTYADGRVSRRPSTETDPR